jgi:hypothetical protein
MYSQDIVPTFEVTMAPEEWEALKADQALRPEREAIGEDGKPYHPVELFRWEENTTTGAMIRLKGQTSFYGPKLQFVISFNEIDRSGRFLGLRKITLDAAPLIDRTLLRDRLALAYFRDLGVPAPCANNARVVINGQYYGLYANIERVDKEFLERNFGKRDADGNLYKGGWDLKTNESREDPEGRRRQKDLLGVRDLPSLVALADLEQAVLMWAGEAVLPQSDGYVVGRGNYYLYDHPERGFLWIPWDLDKAFHFGDVRSDLIQLVALNKAKHPPFEVALADPAWRERYLEAIGRALAAYDPARHIERIDAWAAQIAPAVAEDPNLGHTVFRHRTAVEGLRSYVVDREAFVRDWLACQGTGDEGAWCRSCEEVVCQVK